ncbi:MAG: class I SAM-dependent methyltransferase [Thermoflexales bacterium]
MTATYDQFATVYDLQHQRFLDDAPLYLQLAREVCGARRVLEIGCGSGRLMAPMVEAGLAVTGVDISMQMLRLAAAHLLPVLKQAKGTGLLIQADARAPLPLPPAHFDMAIIALNTFLHNLTRDDQLAVLRHARTVLREGGYLVVDLPPNDEMAYQPDDGQYQLEATLLDPDSGQELRKYVASRLFWATQEQELVYRVERWYAGQMVGEQSFAFKLRHVFRYEMELLLERSGFELARWFGDYDLSTYHEGSPRMIALARSAALNAR